MAHLVRTLVTTTALVLLSSCGGGDDGGESAGTSSEQSSESPSPSEDAAQESADAAQESAAAEMMVNDVESEAKNVGFDVADYAIKNDFTNPTDQADFEKSVDYAKSLDADSKAGYEPKGDTFRICVTRFDGSEPAAWAIYDGKSGLSEGDLGAPQESFCP